MSDTAPNPGTYEDRLEGSVGQLSAASVEVHRARAELDKAEEEWLALYDEVAEALKEEMVEEGRKGDPAEHTITSAARRKDRALYTRLRRAKRALAAAETVSSNRRSEVSAYQSLIRSEHAEAGAQDHLGQAEQRARRWHERMGRQAA